MRINTKMNKDIVEKLKKFKWRYIEKIEGSVHVVKKASSFKEVNIIAISPDGISFWHQDCEDHSMFIELKDILLF